MPTILTEAQCRDFRRDGYLYGLEAMSAADAADRLARIERYETEVGEDASRSLRVRSVLAFPWLVEAARSPAIIGAFENLIGPDILLFLSGVWSKPAGDGSHVTWHQDSSLYAFDCDNSLTAWLALSDATEENGCIRVLPGSHRGPDLQHTETYDKKSLLSRGQAILDLDPTNAVQMPLRAGQFSIHHGRLAHGSDPNRSGSRRLGVSFSVIPADVAPVSAVRSALLLKGGNVHPDWELNPEPRFDLDPVSMAALAKVQDDYRSNTSGMKTDRGTEVA